MQVAKLPICVMYEEQELILVIPVVPVTTLWLIRFSTVENLIKVEILSMTASIGYTASLNVTEWYVTLPSHIKKEKIISLSNMNQASCFEYCNLDLGANCIRVGSQGNASATNIKDIKVIVAYFS